MTGLKWIHLNADRDQCTATAHSNGRSIAIKWVKFLKKIGNYQLPDRQWRMEGGLGGVQTPSPKFRRPSKILPNSTQLWKLLKIAEFRTPTPQDVQKKGSKILKLPSVRNCFTLATTNKLVVIINSLKVPNIKTILLHEMKFLVPNYSCLQSPWLGGYRPQIPFLYVLNWICWTPWKKKSWLRHCR